MRKTAFISICFLLNVATWSVVAQISYGGAPLPYVKQTLRSSSQSDDFFVNMPGFDVESMLNEDSINNINQLRNLRFAKKFNVNITPENSGIHFKAETGMNVWRVGIRSEGAYSLNVIFSEFHIPEGAQLFLYNSDQTKVLGAFTNKNNAGHSIFPVSPVSGDELIIEYQEPENASFRGQIAIREVNHDYTGILKNRPQTPGQTTCHNDPICRDDLDDETQAVCLIVVDGNSFCTASMVNNAEEDATPYLLTSCHCLEVNGKTSEETAKTTVVFFNYQSPACNSGIRGSEEMSMVSPAYRASDRNIDFALLELSEMPPADFRPYYLGWNISESPTPDFTCIHQPNGGIKKIAESKAQLTTVTNQYFDGITFLELWRVSAWNSGTTEGGSSGSPLLDSNKRIVGGLTGGQSVCGNAINDYYWTLKKAWNTHNEPEKQLKIWLDPNDTGITSIGGMNPYTDTTSCVKISNFVRNENYAVYSLSDSEAGHLFGYNSLGTDEYAEMVENENAGYLYGVSLVTPVLNNNNNKTNVSVCVYSGEDKPETLLSEPVVFNPVYMHYQRTGAIGFIEVEKPYNIAAESYLRFAEPIEVGKRFFVSYKLDYAESATPFTVYSAADRGNNDINTAFFKMNEEWIAASGHPSYAMNTSLWINPVIKFNKDTSNLTDSKNKTVRIVYAGNGLYTIESNENLKNAKIEIHTISGQKIAEAPFSSNAGTLDLSQYPKGIYLIKIGNDEGCIFRNKLIR